MPLSGQSDALRQQADALRRQAYDEELTRLEKEIAFKAQDALARWISNEEAGRADARDQAMKEREAQVKSLQNREEELLRQFDEEERRKVEEVRRRRDDEERRKREEEQRRKEKEEEEQKKKKKQAEEQLPKGVTREEMAKMQESRKHLANAESLLNDGNYESALAEVSMALGLVPVFPDAVGLQDKIRQAQRASKEAAEKAQPEEEQAAVVETPASKRNSKLIIAAALGVIVLVAVYILFQNRTIFFPETVSVAVLPFSGESTDELVTAYAEGIPAELAARFRAADHVRSMGIESGYAVSRNSRDPVRAAVAAGFTRIVSGTITHASGGLTLTVAVRDSSGNQQWSHMYENIGSDKGSLLDLVSADLLNELVPSMNHDSKPANREFATPGAFVHYLRAMTLLSHGGSANDLAAFQTAQSGLAEDSTSALLLAAEARAALRMGHDPALQSRYLPLAEAAVTSAEATGGSNGHVTAVRGLLRLVKHEYPAAEKDFKDAITAMGSPELVLADRAHLLLETGKLDDAVSVLRQLCADDAHNARLLRELATAEQLNGATHDASVHFQAAIDNGVDSLVMLSGPITDLLFYDPELLASWSPRVLRALQDAMALHPDDLELVYRSARLQQVLGKGLESNAALTELKKSLAGRLQKDPRDWVSAALMAQTLTRLGQYPDAERYAKTAVDLNPANPAALYRSAQMFAVQMFSHKSGAADSLKKSASLDAIRQAVGLEFRASDLTNGDFYNFRGDADFKKAIQVPAK